MTNQEAIARIREHKIIHKMNEPRAIYISEALDMAVEALENQKSVIEELEKIKEEIKKQYSFYTDYGVQCGCESSCDIIDKHISELKGENNERG